MTWFLVPGKKLKDHLNFHFKILFLESILLSWIRAEDKEICLPPLGCFSTAEPFSHLPLPYRREDVNTRFHLRTRENPYEDHELRAGDVAALQKSNYVSNVTTYFGIHGFSGFDPHVPWREEFFERLLNRENANVIFVSWIEGSLTGLNPAQAAANVRVSAAELAYFCKWLQNITGVSLQSFHIVGFSFGAQIAGLAGAQLPGLGRITGLDPAAMYFAESPPEARLDPTDAEFVDIIHTDAEMLGGMGPSGMSPVGHVDFYPNGGTNQPGCESFLGDLLTFCDHRKSIYYFYGSLDSQNPPLRSYRCDSHERFLAGTCMSCRANRCRSIGIDATRVPRKKHVKMYLHTTAEEPYRVYHYSVRIHFRRGRGSGYHRRHEGRREGRLFVTLHGKNGTSQELPLNSGEPVTMVPGHHVRFLVTSHDRLGRLHSVTFRWDDSESASQNDGFSLWDLWGKRRKRDLRGDDAVFEAFVRKYGDVIADVTSGDEARMRKYTRPRGVKRNDSNKLMALQAVLQVYHPFISLKLQDKGGIWNTTSKIDDSVDGTTRHDDVMHINGSKGGNKHHSRRHGEDGALLKTTPRRRHRRSESDVMHVRKIRVKSGESQESLHFCADGREHRIPQIRKGECVRFSRCEG
ncbi:pancreatic lipase-related protein 2-like [Branchiostoma floridae]|uniref:Pancreatic lipase-related protein 2-like n=1 Tax=Branchiostoma floridae TaxID=7739 RepID=A0A9J7LDM8_BRAFL|nr:pancreatic lipase-related protein 2-like [Branchiostoma floridae]